MTDRLVFERWNPMTYGHGASMDCPRCPSLIGQSHIRAGAPSPEGARYLTRWIAEEYGWRFDKSGRNSCCPLGHLASTGNDQQEALAHLKAFRADEQRRLAAATYMRVPFQCEHANAGDYARVDFPHEPGLAMYVRPLPVRQP